MLPDKAGDEDQGANAPAEEPEDGEAEADRDGEHGYHRYTHSELRVTYARLDGAGSCHA